MLTIWGRKNSSNVKKVLWCADELEIPFDQINAGGSFGVVDGDEYRAKNPNGLVPCIEDDGFVLWESNAIVRYLVARYGDHSTLLPPTLEDRASADRWMDWCSTSLAAPLTVLITQLVRTSEGERDSAKITAAAAQFADAIQVAEHGLATTQWFSGPSFGVGDIPLGVVIDTWYALSHIEHPALPAIEAWHRRLKLRPAFKQWVAVPLT
ncbi:glutathione S-transferase family protein [Carnimonas bestiolae]|uniref:glutathione S-transferase family protein n=1 Tax=Carnimonas bestiolae TaxID=3402172 RepID=UPI003EDC47FC